jgi:hypothetical protein
MIHPPAGAVAPPPQHPLDRPGKRADIHAIRAAMLNSRDAAVTSPPQHPPGHSGKRMTVRAIRASMIRRRDGLVPPIPPLPVMLDYLQRRRTDYLQSRPPPRTRKDLNAELSKPVANDLQGPPSRPSHSDSLQKKPRQVPRSRSEKACMALEAGIYDLPGPIPRDIFPITDYWERNYPYLKPDKSSKEARPVNRQEMQQPKLLDDCIRLIARRVEDDVICSDGKSPRLCLPSRFALGLSAIQDQDSQWTSERDPQDEKAALLANMLFHPTVRIFVTKTHEHTRAEL